MKTPFLLFIVALFFGITSCENQLISDKSLDNEKDRLSNIDLRGKGKGARCEPGAIQTSRDVIQFENAEAFEQTQLFFMCSTVEEQNIWRNSHNVETSRKAYLAFREDASYDNVNSEAELFAIEDQYDGKIKKIINTQAFERSYDVEYPILSDYVDVDGIFMIGNDMLRIIEDRIITVKNGERHKVLLLDKDVEVTENDPPNDGDVISNNPIIVLRSPNCCPSEQFVQKVYTSNGLRRISVAYRLFASYVFQNIGSTNASLGMRMSFKADRRKNYVLWKSWVSDDASSVSLESAFSGSYTFGVGFNTISGTFVWPPEDFEEPYISTATNQSYINEYIELARYNTEKIFPLPNGLPANSTFDACLEEMFIEGTNIEQGESVSYECGEDSDLPAPKIIFFDKNDGEGNIVCEIVLDQPVGHLNFTTYTPCDNDEARSARLVNMKEGMKLRVFDNANMFLNDDFATIAIKQDFDLVVINTFEQNKDEDDYKLTFIEDDGNLDGKISAFIDE